MMFLFYYLIFISIVSGSLFYYDKSLALRNSKKRIAELLLHVLEMMGGVFINLILMHTIRHKNRKLQYKFVTFLIFILWVFLFFEFLIR